MDRPRAQTKWSSAELTLAVGLFAYVLCDILLTPPAHLETRDPALVTPLGIAALALLFVGLALGVVALVFLFRRSVRAPVLAIVGAVLYLPAPITELTGHFSSLRPPTAIASIELIQAVVAVVVIGAAYWVRRSTQA
jgi:hypothetical protein